MSVSYLNWRGPQGRETIDQLDSADFADWKAARAERSRLAHEYALAGMGGAYWSSRPCKGWNDKPEGGAA